MKYYKVEINETARGSLRADPDDVRLFNTREMKFSTLEEVKRFLVDHYGKMPGMKNKIYRDTKQGTEEVGFLHSFWNRDYSHNSKAWYQTDWIEVMTVEEKPVKLRT